MAELHVLLQTDIVDSTQIAEQLGDEAWAALSEAHDVAARNLLPKWRGREIDKSDGFLLLFTNVADAVGYALDYHSGATALAVPLAARAGIHVGPLIVRDNAVAHVARGAKVLEVDGVAKPLTARVMAIAGGRQTLLTAAARHALGPTDWRVQSHGHWRMKGLAEPLELFEVGGLHAPFVPPADSTKGYRVVQRGEVWVPKQELRHSLPAERDSFVGRGGALIDLARHFDAGARLVTIVGMGGAGKTRLAQRFGWRWLGDYPGGVWFCDLSQARSLEGIAHAGAAGLDVPLGSNDAVAQLGHAIVGRRGCLVILDNFEQVARLAEATLGCWLNAAAEASFLVTSRESLGIAGEHVLTLDALEPDEAVSLFTARTLAATNRPIDKAEDRDAVGPLVRLLDGLPLAIELIAARTRSMSPSTLLVRFSERSRLLATHAGRQGRHANLRATLDWSWGLLLEGERAALAQLSVFEGSFSLEAAEDVVHVSACDEEQSWVPDLLQALVEKSLVRTVDYARFDLLVSVHAYAAERLAAPGGFPGSGPDAVAAAEERHWNHFGQLDAAALVADRTRDADNLVVACRRATARRSPQAAVRALDAAWHVLRRSGPFQVAVALASGVEAIVGLTPDALAATRWVAGSALQALGQHAEARRAYESALPLAREAANRAIEARLLCSIGEQRVQAGAVSAAQIDFEAALAIATAHGDQRLSCQLLNDLGSVAMFDARWDEACSSYDRALALARRLGDPMLEGGVLGNLGTLNYRRGEVEPAEAFYVQALVMARRAGDRRWEGNALCNLGMICFDLGRHAEAKQRLDTALSLARDLGHLRLEATVLCNLGIVSEASAESGIARLRFEEAVKLADRAADLRMLGQFLVYLGRLYARIGLHDLALERLERSEVILRDLGDHMTLGLLLCARAETLRRKSGDSDTTRQIAVEAHQIADKLGVPKESELRRELAALESMSTVSPC